MLTLFLVIVANETHITLLNIEKPLCLFWIPYLLLSISCILSNVRKTVQFWERKEINLLKSTEMSYMEELWRNSTSSSSSSPRPLVGGP